MLNIKNLKVKIEEKEIIKDVSFELSENEILMLIGPNGSGKTTIIKSIMQSLKHDGVITLYDKDISSFSLRELAKNIGGLMQKHDPQFAYSVYNVVSIGRYSYSKGILGGLSSEDIKKIDEALEITGIKKLKDQSVITLSGGELQRVFLAQLFAQNPKILILDEPTNNLDLRYQIEIFDIVKEWSKQPGRAVISIVHDLNLVYTYGTKALLLEAGEVYAYGRVKDVLSKENLKAVYHVDVAAWMQKLLKYWDE